MKTNVRTIVLLILAGIIFFTLTCSCNRLNEGFANMVSWKTEGTLDFAMPYNSNNESSMLMFQNNKISPSCCSRATYSSSSGCVCTTPEQQMFLNQRGGNRTVEDGF